MLLLSLDLAFSPNNFTLWDASKRTVYTLYAEDRGRKALEIFPKIFEDLSVPIDKVEAFAVNVGVGYSTGLRIAVSMAKTYAQISGRPLITFTSCEALLENFPLEGTFLVLFKVSRYFVGGVYKKKTDGIVPLQRPIIAKGENISQITQGVEGIVLPEGIGKEFKTVFGDVSVPLYPVGGEILSLPGVKLAARKLQRGELSDPLKVEPLYFRPPV